MENTFIIWVRHCLKPKKGFGDGNGISESTTDLCYVSLMDHTRISTILN